MARGNRPQVRLLLKKVSFGRVNDGLCSRWRRALTHSPDGLRVGCGPAAERSSAAESASPPSLSRCDTPPGRRCECWRRSPSFTARRSSRTALIGTILSQIIKTIGSIRSIDDQMETLLMLLPHPLRFTRARCSSSSASAHELLLFSGGFQAPARFTRRFRPFVRRVLAFILLRQAPNTPDGSARPLFLLLQPQSLGTSRRVDFAPHQQAEICRGTRDPAFMTSNGPLDETPERRVNADLDLNSSCQSRAYDSASDGRKKGTRGCQKTERKAFARREFHDEE